MFQFFDGIGANGHEGSGSEPEAIRVHLPPIFAKKQIDFSSVGAKRVHPGEKRVELNDGTSVSYGYDDTKYGIPVLSSGWFYTLGRDEPRFARATIAGAEASAAEALGGPPDLVLALHACDTATDDALALAIARGADHVAVVPCCQAEVARQLDGKRPDRVLAALSAHPWHRRELGSHLTNVVRALALEARGYQVTVTELTGWEHSLKNELILARRVQRFDRDAQARLDELCARFGIQPAIVRGLPAPA